MKDEAKRGGGSVDLSSKGLSLAAFLRRRRSCTRKPSSWLAVRISRDCTGWLADLASKWFAAEIVDRFVAQVPSKFPILGFDNASVLRDNGFTPVIKARAH